MDLSVLSFHTLITNAFLNVTLGGGVSLHQTIAIDNYGADADLQVKIKADERRDWTKLIDNPALKEIHGIGGLSFFDDVGLRFHLPAYMCMALKHPEAAVIESLIFQLTHLSEYQLSRFAILNTEQKSAVCQFLHYLQHHTGDLFEPDHPAIEGAIREYWSKQ